MTRARFFGCDPHLIRRHHNQTYETAKRLHEIEADLISLLLECDDQRAFVRLGFKSLKGYCTYGLRFTRVQAQRIVTEVRRLQQAKTALEFCPQLESKKNHLDSEEAAFPFRTIAGPPRCTDVKDGEASAHIQHS